MKARVILRIDEYMLPPCALQWKLRFHGNNPAHAMGPLRKRCTARTKAESWKIQRIQRRLSATLDWRRWNAGTGNVLAEKSLCVAGYHPWSIA